MAIILMEGSDLSGKSTIAKALSNVLQIPYYKGKGPTSVKASIKDRAIVELNQITEFLEQTGHSVIIDRNYLSEWVYGSVFHRDIDEAHLKDIDEKYSKMDAINIIITASDDVLEKRLNERGDKMIDMAGIIMVKDKYASLEGQLKTPMVFIDNSDMSVEEVVEVIVEMLRAVEEDGDIKIKGNKR